MRTCDETKLHQLEEYTQQKKISEYFAEWGLFSESDKYCCFMHDDLYPSLFIDDTNGIFYCHSCGRGGGTAKLVSYYYQHNFEATGYLNALNMYLSHNIEAKEALGFSSIFDHTIITTQESLDDILHGMDHLTSQQTQMSCVQLDYKPDTIKSNFESILEYLIQIQNKFTI